jgi:hypothetical protein
MSKRQPTEVKVRKSEDEKFADKCRKLREADKHKGKRRWIESAHLLNPRERRHTDRKKAANKKACRKRVDY